MDSGGLNLPWYSRDMGVDDLREIEEAADYTKLQFPYPIIPGDINIFDNHENEKRT